MSRVLMCATPIYGHFAPMITIGRHLVSTGHQVRILTGSRYVDAVKAAGIEPIPLPASCTTEIAARVAWAGAGINLRTGTPTSAAIGEAVGAIFNNDGYRIAARVLRDEMSSYSALTTIDSVVREATPNEAEFDPELRSGRPVTAALP